MDVSKLHAQIVDRAGVGLLVYELEKDDEPTSLRLLLVNQTAADLLRSDASGLPGLPILEAFPNLADTGIPERFRDAILTGKSVDLGDVHYSDERIPKAIFASEATPIDERCIVVSFRNVTELRELQREREAKLLTMEKMAMLGNMLAGIAHEIRTPLGAMKSNTDMLQAALSKVQKKLGDDSPVKRLLPRMEAALDVSNTAVGRMGELVDSLRRMGRSRESEMGAVDIHDVIESTLTLLRHETKYGVEIHKSFGEVAHVHGDAGQLTQVLANLILNACQAMDGKGNLWITTENADDTIVVTVRDDGCGIASAQIDQIFDAGFTTKDATAGTGLGLAITSEIVRTHRGTITVTSAVGDGATFVVTLVSAASQA